MASEKMTLTRVLRALFGTFMVVVYIGMAVLLAINFFNWSDTGVWKWARWGMAAVFAAYGLYRGYRQFTGQDYYRVQDLEERYGTYEQSDDKTDKQQ